MNIAQLFVALTLGLAQVSSAPEVEVGDRVVVRGGISGCPEFPGVLAMHVAKAGEQMDFFGIRVPVIGRTDVEIESDLAHELSSRRENPERVDLKIDVLKTDQEYLMIREEVLNSYTAMLRCVHSDDGSGPSLEELMQHLLWERTA